MDQSEVRARLWEKIRQRAEWMRKNPQAMRGIIRAKVSMDDEFRMEARAGKFHFRSDEPEAVGGRGSAPQPMQYLIASIGF